MDSIFKIKTDIFEGPLDILLSLIEKRKLLINDISLAKVTDDYIAHIKDMTDFPVLESANFLVVASTLIYIKSKSLIPDLSLTDEEEGDIKDLEKRLKIYKRFKQIANTLKNIFGDQLIYWRDRRENAPIFTPEKSITKENLLSALKDILKMIPNPTLLPKAIVKKVINIETMINNLMERIKSCKKMSFSEFSSVHKSEKINIIVGFLAMLELVKQGSIQVSQEEQFREIVMEGESVPIS